MKKSSMKRRPRLPTCGDSRWGWAGQGEGWGRAGRKLLVKGQPEGQGSCHISPGSGSMSATPHMAPRGGAGCAQHVCRIMINPLGTPLLSVAWVEAHHANGSLTPHNDPELCFTPILQMKKETH